MFFIANSSDDLTASVILNKNNGVCKDDNGKTIKKLAKSQKYKKFS